jgi:hypothetical protein
LSARRAIAVEGAPGFLALWIVGVGALAILATLIRAALKL